MRFLLIRPHVSLGVAKSFMGFLHLEPLDLEIVAGGIGPGHETRILDLTLSRNAERSFRAGVRDFRPDVVGFSGYSNQAINVKNLARIAKKIVPESTVIVGGVHATIAPEDFALPGVVDVIVRGEGGTGVRELVGHLETGGAVPAGERLLPVGADRFAELAASPPPELPEYGKVPEPRRDLVDRNRYFCIWSGTEGERVDTIFPRVATVRTSTGCPHRCSFCVVHYLARGKYLQREPEDVVDEIAAVPEDYIYFVDDEMFVNARRVEEIARLLIDRRIRKQYISWARSDTICKDVEVFRLWKKAGLRTLYVGLESMEERDLRDYNKGYESDTNRRAVEILRDLGIGLHAALIVNPSFTEKDFLQLREELDRLGPAEVTFTVFSPPPGTPLWDDHKDDFICDDPYSFYDCMHTIMPAALPLNRFYRYFSLLYLFALRRNPWRVKRIKVPLRDMFRLFLAGVRCGWELRRIYRDYDRSLW